MSPKENLYSLCFILYSLFSKNFPSGKFERSSVARYTP